MFTQKLWNSEIHTLKIRDIKQKRDNVKIKKTKKYDYYLRWIFKIFNSATNDH
jgi:hypothetical protein